jgi:hypothetical protein
VTDRSAAAGAYEYFAGDDGWSSELATAIPVVQSGRERGAVPYHPGLGSYVRVFSVGFSSTLEVRSAPAQQGPWTTSRMLVACELPADDPDAFCREPVLRPWLMDPLRPREVALTYDIGIRSRSSSRSMREGSRVAGSVRGRSGPGRHSRPERGAAG